MLKIDMNILNETNSINTPDMSISNEMNTNERVVKMKRTRKRPSKLERFQKEHEQLCMELEELMGLNEEVRGVLLYDLEKNERLKEHLIKNLDLIKRTYRFGNWNYFIKPEEERDPIGLLKSIFKTDGYELITRLKYTERDGIKKKYSQIFWIKKMKAKK
jgi:hypothetical protein